MKRSPVSFIARIFWSLLLALQLGILTSNVAAAFFGEHLVLPSIFIFLIQMVPLRVLTRRKDGSVYLT